MPTPEPPPPVTPEPTPGETPPDESTESTEAENTVVPNIVGLPVSAATTVLRDWGLVLGQISRSLSPIATETVAAQRPLPGAIVVRGTPVDVVVAEVSVRVPDLVGLTRAAAVDALRNVGLEPGRVTERVSSDPPGRIVQQAPPAGTAVPQGSTVEFVVATAGSVAPWVLGVAAFALTAGVAGVAGYRIGRRLPASVQVKPHFDPGLQDFDAGKEGLVRSEVRLGGSWDPGTQHLEPADVHVVNQHTEGE